MKKTTQSNWVVLATLFIFYGLYLVVNQWPLERYKIFFMPCEEKIPFLPWTIFIYLSLFFQAVIFLKYLPEKLFWKTMVLGFVILAVHLAFFILIPARYPRESYPSDNIVLKLFRIIDTSGNCLPSLHVSCAILFANCYCLWKESKFKKVIACIWSVLIILSTLTTKQHYILDILAGIIVTRLVIITFNRISTLRE